MNDIKLVPVPRLSSKFPPSGEPNFEITSDSQGGATRYTKLIGERDCVLYGKRLQYLLVTEPYGCECYNMASPFTCRDIDARAN